MCTHVHTSFTYTIYVHALEYVCALLYSVVLVTQFYQCSRELGSQTHPPPACPTPTLPTSASLTDTTHSLNESAVESDLHSDVQQRLQLDEAKDLVSDLHVVGDLTASNQQPPSAQSLQLPHEEEAFTEEAVAEGTSSIAHDETSDEWSSACVDDDRVSYDDGEAGILEEVSGAVAASQSSPADPLKGVSIWPCACTRKPWIRTICGFCCTKLGSSLCAEILG